MSMQGALRSLPLEYPTTAARLDMDIACSRVGRPSLMLIAYFIGTDGPR